MNIASWAYEVNFVAQWSYIHFSGQLGGVITLFLPLQATTTFPLNQMSHNYAYQSEKKHQETDTFSYIFTESSVFFV